MYISEVTKNRTCLQAFMTTFRKVWWITLSYTAKCFVLLQNSLLHKAPLNLKTAYLAKMLILRYRPQTFKTFTRKPSFYKDGNGSQLPAKLFCLKCPHGLEINKSVCCQFWISKVCLQATFEIVMLSVWMFPLNTARDEVGTRFHVAKTWMDSTFLMKILWQFFSRFIFCFFNQLTLRSVFHSWLLL